MAQVMTQAKFDGLKPKAKPYRVAVGHNVWVNVTPTNFKTFIYRKMQNRKNMVITLGSSEGMELHDAQTTGSLYNRLLANGEHLPNVQAKAARSQMTWREAAAQYLETRQDISEDRVKRLHKILVREGSDQFNDMPISAIDITDIEAAVLPTWHTASGKDIVGVYGKCWQWACIKVGLDTDVHAQIIKLKSVTLPQFVREATNHQGQLSFADLQKWLAGLDANNALAKRDKVAGEVIFLTNKRPSEILGGKWSEIDFDNALWVIPKERMKLRIEHTMPLSSRVVEILKAWRKESGDSEYIFPAKGKMKHLNKTVLLQSFDRHYPLGTATNGGKAVVHGTSRGTFKTWSKDQLDDSDRYIYENDAVELQLAHAVGTEVERAYNTANGMKMRRKLVEDYSLAARSLCQ